MRRIGDVPLPLSHSVAAYSGSFKKLSWKRGWMPVFRCGLLDALGAIVSAGQFSTRMRLQTIADESHSPSRLLVEVSKSISRFERP